MKTQAYIYIISFFTLIFISCNNHDQKECETEKKECCKKEAESNSELTKAIAEESVFNITSDWKTQDNEIIKLNSLAGKIIVTAMVFTHCEGACPRIVADIQRIEKSFSDQELKQIIFLLISMDPERDTPARFKEFAKEYKLNANWILISANEDATTEIANVLNVRIKKIAGGGFDHSNTIHVMNQQGLIVSQQNGLEQEPKGTIESIKSLLK